MRPFPRRSHIPHRELPGAAVCITWRVHRRQAPLTAAELDETFEIIRRCEPDFAELIAAVVMNDHAHVLVRPHAGITAKRLASAWKGASAHKLCGPGRRTSPLWQREYFDRWMDSPDQLGACRRYILENPRRRWPLVREYRWVFPVEIRRSPPADDLM